MHLAQINIARLLEPLDSPLIADFVANLDPINTLAEQSPGFVWRLKDDTNNATDFRPFGDDLLIVNMSVWEDIDTLRAFAFQTAHSDIMKRRREWFSRFPTAYLALWWIPEGHVPTIDEAKERLQSLDAHGDTPFAFTFRKLFPPPTAS
ncbi:DUF3291 domain-containing protein [Fibrella sp. WM1]|uniref:DUF3291 domain-containing protein n=1 Tax=Fibrella musci TaxID=3242485 RepID=UPI00351FEC10